MACQRNILLQDICADCAPECNTRREYLAGNFNPPPNGHYCSIRTLLKLTGTSAEAMNDPYFSGYMLKQMKCIEMFKWEEHIADKKGNGESEESWQEAYLRWIDDSKGESFAMRCARAYQKHG